MKTVVFTLKGFYVNSLGYSGEGATSRVKKNEGNSSVRKRFLKKKSHFGRSSIGLQNSNYIRDAAMSVFISGITASQLINLYHNNA